MIELTESEKTSLFENFSLGAMKTELEPGTTQFQEYDDLLRQIANSYDINEEIICFDGTYLCWGDEYGI